MIKTTPVENHGFNYILNVEGDTKQEVEEMLDHLVAQWPPAYFPARSNVTELIWGKWFGVFEKAKKV